MKANELMIGDIIYQNRPEGKVVTRMKARWFDPPYDISDFIEPVTITPKNLLENEYELAQSEHECYIARGLDYSIKWRPNDYHVLKIHRPQTNGQKGHCTITITECLYVHQLQHALRLCGLTELADNFKV